MSKHIYHTSPNMLDTLSQEFNGTNIYGVEYIIDEIDANNEDSKSIKNDPADTDWFGLSDLCM